jgi:hypothetical protein
MSASGFDNYTGHFYSGLTAPAGATVISPITSLIDAVGSEATVRAALGLNDGSLAIDPNVNLLTFDAPRELQNATTSVAHDARIVTALNLMILNLGIIGTYPATAIDNRVEVDDIVSVLASVIEKSGSARFDQETTYAAILAQLERFSFIQDRSFPAASGILRDYWNFVMPQIVDETSLYRSASLFRYYLASVAIHAADEFYSPVKQSVSLAELQTMMAYTAEVPQPNVASGFYALPDYMDLSFNSLLLKDCTTRPAHPKCNDYNRPDGSQGVGPDTLTVTDVSVPQSGNLISVQLNVDGSILIERKPMALGLVYFNYVVKNAEGKTSTSRYYITLHRNW